ncbi:MAG: hypothetical protein AAF655_17460 [Bacteroidota bacterium]
MKEPLSSREIFFRFYVSWILRIFYVLLILLLGVYVFTLAGGSSFSLLDSNYLWISLGGLAVSILMGALHYQHDLGYEPNKIFSILHDPIFQEVAHATLIPNVAEERLEGSYKEYPLFITPRLKTPITHYLEIGLTIDPSPSYIEELEILSRPYELNIHEGNFLLIYRFNIPMVSKWNINPQEIEETCELILAKIPSSPAS